MEYKSLVLFISGKQGSGKTTLASNLSNWLLGDDRFWLYNLKFADPLYEMHNAIYGVLERYGQAKPVKTDGTLLQILGTEWGRKCVHPDLWVNILKSRVIDALKSDLWPRHKIVIVDDARLQNEVECFDKYQGLEVIKLRLECNEGFRKARAEKWRENTMHLSEVALDAYHGFDHIIYTDRHEALDTLELAKRCIIERLK